MYRLMAYKTEDGKIFDNEIEAARHEAALKIHDWADCKKISTDGMVACDSLFTAMIDDAEQLAYIFASLARALPRSDVAAVVDGLVDLPDDRGKLWFMNDA